MHRTWLMKWLHHHFWTKKPNPLCFLLNWKLTQLFEYFHADFQFSFLFIVYLCLMDHYLGAQCESYHNSPITKVLIVTFFTWSYASKRTFQIQYILGFREYLIWNKFHTHKLKEHIVWAHSVSICPVQSLVCSDDRDAI